MLLLLSSHLNYIISCCSSSITIIQTLQWSVISRWRVELSCHPLLQPANVNYKVRTEHNPQIKTLHYGKIGRDIILWPTLPHLLLKFGDGDGIILKCIWIEFRIFRFKNQSLGFSWPLIGSSKVLQSKKYIVTPVWIYLAFYFHGPADSQSDYMYKVLLLSTKIPPVNYNYNN